MKQKFFLLSIFLLSITFSFSQTEGEKYIIDKDGRMSLNYTKKENFVKAKLINKLVRSLSIVWNNPDYDVSDNEAVDSWDPRMDVAADGTTYVVYNDNHAGTGLQKIMFRKKDTEGNWTDPIYIDKGGIIGERNNHFPAVAVSPNGDVHAVYNVWAYENVRNFIGYSFYDASEDTWSDGQEISTAGGSVSNNNYHHEVYSTDNNLPIVFWGFDNREDENYEEVYMKYFDGTDWSDDILVSTPSDNLSATFPFVTSIPNNKAMIVFGEKTGNPDEEKVLKYRIYDEVLNTMTPIQTIPQTIHYLNSSRFKYDIAQKDNDNVIIAIWENRGSSPYNDTIKCINYNISTDQFVMSDHKFLSTTTGFWPKHLSVDCNSDGECAIIYTDTYLDNCNFFEFDEATGFSEVQVFCDEDVMAGEYPECKFDAAGNIHTVWADLRFDPPGGYVRREVFYEMGTNIENTHTITFVVTESDETTPIEDAEVTFYSTTQNTNASGEIDFDYILPGTYTWTVSKAGYETETGEITVTQNETVEVSLNIATYSVTFIVTDESSNPVEDALVDFNSIAQNTDSNGETIFENILYGTYTWIVSDVNYETETGSIDVAQDEIIEVSLDPYIVDIKFIDNEINIFPNPSNGLINIVLPDNISQSKVTVTNVTGRIIEQKTVNNQDKINLQVEKGIYFIKFIFNDKSVVSKIIIQ